MTRQSPVVAGDWLTRASLLGGVLLVVIGTLVLAGWQQRIDVLMSFRPDAAPMPVDTALSLLVLGIVLLAFEWKADLLVWLAVIPAAIGFLTLAQQFAGWPLRLDEFFMQLPGAADPTVPGGLSRFTALSFLAAGLCLLWLKVPLLARGRPLVIVLSASLIISFGLAPLLGWILGLSKVTVLNQVLRATPLGALGLILLGSLLLSRIWRDDPNRAASLPGWLPAPVLAVGITLTLLITAALRDREVGLIRSTTQLAINNVATVLTFELDNEAKTLQRMAARWARTDRLTDSLRDRDSEAYREDFPALRSLTWIDASRHTSWVFPRQGNEYLLEYNHDKDPVRRGLVRQVLASGQPAFSSPTPLPLGGQGFLTCVLLPGPAGSDPQVLMGEFSYPRLLEAVQNRLHLSTLYAVAIDIDDHRVLAQSPPGAVRQDLREESAFNLFNQRIRISLSPSAVALPRGRRFFPELVTALGLGLTVLLGAGAHLARTALVGRRAAEQTNVRLVAENEERRRAEQALPVSQAAIRKLSLVASSTGNLVAITDAAGRLEWINDSFVRLFGFSLTEVDHQPLTQLLVSPDTDPATVSRLRSTLQRAAPFNADLVCHARDGRRYHLHLDLQPVRNETGAVENFIALLVDLTARVETENHLRRAKEEADTASRAKSEFLASMSHEIRTPMNGVIGMTSLLLETPLTPEQRDCVSTIRVSGDALLSIINDILDFSKIESGKMELEQQPLDLAVCIEEVLDLFAVQAAAKHIDLAYAIDAGVPTWIMGDAVRLRQIVVNLVNNAIKFTSQGYVSVEARLAPPCPAADRGDHAGEPALADRLPASPSELIALEVVVRDSGIGISAEEQGRLFQPFSQIDSSTTRTYGGTGLGLAISRRLCKLMGGDIRVESVPSQGSVFTFLIETRPASPPFSLPVEELPAPLRGRSAWAIDDHEVNLHFLATTLGAAGLPCVTAASAQAALALARECPAPALLIVDQFLPDREGGRLAQELRACWQQPQLPIVLLLPPGEAIPGTCLKELAPAAHLLKPLKAAALLLTIRSLFTSPAAPADRVGAKPRLLSEDIPLKILLVEDNPVNRNVALSMLGRLGYRADAVVNGLEAVQAFDRRHYPLVMMDLQMPTMDGLEATRQLRRRLPADRQPCIIAVTANALLRDREMCLAAGMDDYITKPLKLDDLAAAIRRNCGAKVAE
jgi:PAS domain S-box-containing protein